MKANETKLQQIIEGIKQYLVPLFQRPYSWDKSQWESLWVDINELCGASNPRAHFMGSIVTLPTESVPEGVSKYLLIDGQQRLTTVFILLALLRDTLEKQGDGESVELAHEINENLLINKWKKGLDHYKMLPTQTDRDSFIKIMDKAPLGKEDHITKAYKFFERKVKSVDDKARLKTIISNYLSIVSIVLDSDDNPHLVFQSLNGTGTPLTQSDFFRNYFFMRIHTDRHEEVYSELWQPMQVMLGDSLTEFVRHYLMRNGIVIRKNEVFSHLKEVISNGEALEELKRLKRFAEYYHKIIRPDNENVSAIRKKLQRLNRIESTTCYPFLLNCYEDFRMGLLDELAFVEILKTVENFLIRRFVCNVPTDRLKGIFPSLYNQAKLNPSPLSESVKKVLETKGYPTDIEFRHGLTTAKFYGAGDRAKKTKLILETIEESYKHKEQVSFEKMNLSIEHIMPQTLTAEWEEHLGEEGKAEYPVYLHSLGNLTLTAYNSELANDSFYAKKKMLGDSHLEINKYFNDKDCWTIKEIEERTQSLADLILKIWPFFGYESSTENIHDVSGLLPRSLEIVGQKIAVRSWIDVLENTLNVIADLDPERFQQLASDSPKLIGPDKSQFNEFRVLKNGMFIEVQLSAAAIRRYCIHAVESIDLTAENWIIKMKEEPEYTMGYLF